MPPALATAGCIVLICFLFWLDRDRAIRTSGALWLPTIWLSLACSRSVSMWLQLGAPISSAEQVSEGSPVDRLVYSALVAAGLIVLFHRSKRLKGVLGANRSIILFFLYCGVSILWSDYPEVAVKRWPKAVGDLVMILIVLSESEPLAAIKRFLARPTYVLIPTSVLFIKYYPQLGVGFGPWGGKAAYCGVTTNKNTLGVICLLFGVGAVWRLITAYQSRQTTNRKSQMMAQVVVLVMVFWLFQKANSMTSLNCFLMASILLFVTSYRRTALKPLLVHILIAAMVIASVSVLFLGVSSDVLKSMGRDPTLTDRTEVWGILLSLVHNPIGGTGFESFWLGPRLAYLWEKYWWRPNEAHNGYLEIYINLGWIGVIGLFAVLVNGYCKVFKGWQDYRLLGRLGLTYFVVGIIYNCTEAAFFKMMAPAWMFLLFAMVSTSVYRKCEDFDLTSHSSRSRKEGISERPVFIDSDLAKALTETSYDGFENVGLNSPNRSKSWSL